MNFRTKQLGLLSIPILLTGVLWCLNWQRLHPPPTALDEQIRVRLLSADRIDVEVETVIDHFGSSKKLVAHLSPSETKPVVRYSNLTSEQPKMWGTGYVPIVYLNFYKQGKIQGFLSTSYSGWGYNYFLDPAYSKSKISRGLHPTTLLRLRNLIAQHPEIMKALVEMGTESQYLAPNAFTKNKN